MSSLAVASSGQKIVKSLPHGGVVEHIITAAPAPSDPLSAFGEVGADRAVLSQLVFGGSVHKGDALARFGAPSWPITWVTGDRCSGEQLAGTQWYAVSDAQVQTVELDGQAVGRCYQDDDARYCYLGGLMPLNTGESRPKQARNCLQRMQAALATVDMDFTHVVRTWFYPTRLLEWYREFNVVRNTFFEEQGIFQRTPPASTGIGASGGEHVALTASLLAIKPRNDRMRIFAPPSPMQHPAMEYRSAFSRAVEVDRPGLRQLFISGTASIAPGGESVHHGDPVRQIALTMAVISAILKSRGMNWPDTTRMIAYFKHLRDVPHFVAWQREHGLGKLPVICVHADICRDELLFEAELDAASVASR